MAFEKRNNTGSLFRNDRKEKEGQPDYNGSLIVNGTEFWISAWLKDGQKGKFFSMAIKPKEERANEIRGNSRPQRSFDEDLDGDSIPF